MKRAGYGIVDGNEALEIPSGFDPLQYPLSPSGGLMEFQCGCCNTCGMRCVDRQSFLQGLPRLHELLLPRFSGAPGSQTFYPTPQITKNKDGRVDAMEL